MWSVPAALHHPSSLETARFPGGPFHLTAAGQGRRKWVNSHAAVMVFLSQPGPFFTDAQVGRVLRPT
jgi:hypothetical protein